MNPKKIRQKIRLNIQQMADLCGVHRQTWIKWEREERRPDNAATRLMEALIWLYDRKLLPEFIDFVESLKKKR